MLRYFLEYYFKRKSTLSFRKRKWRCFMTGQCFYCRSHRDSSFTTTGLLEWSWVTKASSYKKWAVPQQGIIRAGQVMYKEKGRATMFSLILCVSWRIYIITFYSFSSFFERTQSLHVLLYCRTIPLWTLFSIYLSI